MSKRAWIGVMAVLVALSVGLAAGASSLFEPSNEYLRTTSSPAGVNSMYVSLWFRVANTTARHTLFVLEQSGTNQRVVLYADGLDTYDLTDRVWYFVQNSGGGVFAAGYTTNSFSADTWHHVVFGVYDYETESESEISLDGGGYKVSTYSYDNVPWFSNYYVQVGGDNREITAIPGDNNFLPSPSGEVAEVAVWSGEVYRAEQSAMRRYSPLLIRRNALVFYAPLIRERQDVISGCTLTGYNSPDVGDHPPVRR